MKSVLYIIKLAKKDGKSINYLHLIIYPKKKSLYLSERVIIGSHEATTWTPCFFLASFCIPVHQIICARRIGQLFTCRILHLKQIQRSCLWGAHITKNVCDEIWYLLKFWSVCWILCPARAKKGFYLPRNVIHARTQFLEFIKGNENIIFTNHWKVVKTSKLLSVENTYRSCSICHHNVASSLKRSAVGEKLPQNHWETVDIHFMIVVFLHSNFNWVNAEHLAFVKGKAYTLLLSRV